MSASTSDWSAGCTRSDLGALSFVVLRDRAGLVQVVLSEPLELAPETVVEVEGQAVAAAQAPGGVELRKPTFRILAQPEEPPPVELRRPMVKATLPTILDFAPVTLRHPRQRALFELAAASLHGFRASLDGSDSPRSQRLRLSPS
jgi:nondiscriminating aspartyl-tRNA synthetase